MADAAEEVKFSVKVLVNKEGTKVLFAQVDSDFADVLLSFLTLPLGTIVRLLKKHYGDDRALIFGSLTTLYNGVANLDTVHFCTEAGKLMLLNPRSSFGAECRALKVNLDDTEPAKLFICERPCFSKDKSNISMYYGTSKCCHCGKTMNREVEQFTESSAIVDAGDAYGVFTKKAASFLVGDDLKIVPNGMGSIIQTFSNLDIKDSADGAKQRTLTLGINEIMDLLKGSLLSHTPLTDLVLRTSSDFTTVKVEPGMLLHQIEKGGTCDSEKKMNLKVMVQKSTNRLLFAQAGEDFVDFLFSFLTIPLGEVECLLGSDTDLRNVDNLYRSAANLNNFLKNQGDENSLLKPGLAPNYLSKYQLFPLNETRQRFYGRGVDPKGQGSYVTGPVMYMVTDDLTVTPLCMLSSLSLLEKMNISLSDVEELSLDVGLDEAISILRASLTSSCALTNGLKNHSLKKQQKQEKTSLMRSLS